MELFGDISPNKADAIHRALLAGLLGNVAARSKAHEYAGARGAKLAIFPGSALFRSEPRWITAAEVVQTTKLYARTVAPCDPRWIERVGAHLVRRSYSDPQWDARTAHVYAIEKVTLHGLVIVPARRVEYGRIDPRTARELFILHALVRNELQSSGEFHRHNRALLARIVELQVRSRRNDLLSEEQARFGVIDQRLAPHVHNGPALDRWRREVEPADPRLLFFEESDFVAPGVELPPPEAAPDEIFFGELSVGLEYRFDVAHPADGVTAVVPIEVLDEVSSSRLEWLVPGMLPQKILALIRSLPRDLRKQLIPAGDIAHEAAASLPFGQGSLLAALAAFLGKRTGSVISVEAFDLSELAPWMTFNVRVVDASGRTLASGRDLPRLRGELGFEIQRIWADAASGAGEWKRSRIVGWDFGDLPDRVPVHVRGMTLWGYPALEERAQEVRLRLFESPAAAGRAMWGGLRRLFLLELGGQVQQLLRALPRYSEMLLLFAPVGEVQQLENDLLMSIADRALFPGLPEFPRGQARFAAMADRAWRELPAVARDVAQVVAATLEAHQAAALAIATQPPYALARAVADMRQQLRLLVYPGFICKTPREWLPHLPRFVKGISVRLGKLKNAGLERDNTGMLRLSSLQAEWTRRRDAKSPPDPNREAALDAIRWLIEELRISLFAQELRTSIPVSVERVREALEAIPEPAKWPQPSLIHGKD